MDNLKADRISQTQGYSLISRLIHWLSAVIILILLFVGSYMTTLDFDEGSGKIQLYAMHKSFGLLILGLAFIRIFWLLLTPKPAPLTSYKKWEELLSKSVRIFIYISLFALPLSGWVMSSAGGYPVSFFGIDLPPLVAKNKEIFNESTEIHETIAFILLLAIALHMAGAFKHHFIDKDITLQRMTGENLGLRGGLIIAAAFTLLFLLPLSQIIINELNEDEGEYKNESKSLEIKSSDVEGKEKTGKNSYNGEKYSAGYLWNIDTNQSRINFTISQYGQPLTGSFKLDGKIIFDPDNLENNLADITIDIASIDTGSDDRDSQALGSDWFDAKNFPVARFISTKFKNNGDGSYVASGEMTIRDKTMPLDLPFELEIKSSNGGKEKVAKMSASLSINRLDFGIGRGQWQKTDTIGNKAKLNISLTANIIDPDHN